MNLKGEFAVAPYIDQGLYYPNMSRDEVESAYNGIGADWMDAKIRKLLDVCFSDFKDAIIIHDCDYDRGLTETDKKQADKRLKWNLYRCIWHNVSIFNFKRMFLLFGCVRIMYRAVQLVGDEAFWKNKNREQNGS